LSGSAKVGAPADPACRFAGIDGVSERLALNARKDRQNLLSSAPPLRSVCALDAMSR